MTVSTGERRLKPPILGPSGKPLDCPHRPPCPGCPRFGLPGLAQAAESALGNLAAQHGLGPVPVISGEMTGFRQRARLAIRGRVGSPKLGLFELGTHRVVHIPNCVVQDPLINRVAEVVRRALVEARVSPYSDQAHAGVARYLQVVVERSSRTAQVTLVANAEDPGSLEPCFDLIRDRLGPELHSLWWNRNTERANTILGSEFRLIAGAASVVEHFGGAAIHYPPGAFGQNNLGIAERIIEHVQRFVPEGSSVAEFYAGVGAIGLSLLERVRELRLNEISPASLAGLEMGRSALAPSAQLKTRVFPGVAGAALEIARDAEVVIADPPRKGLDPELTAALATAPPARFIYVSCGLESFLRDAAALIDSGKLRLTALTAFTLLPFTEHVETVGVFERRVN